MAKPRIFISSTHYGLKHLRTALEEFIENLGYEPILSEKGNIVYLPDKPLDESCYKEVQQADIFVLIVGGRYGSKKSGSTLPSAKNSTVDYDSITREEFRTAVNNNIPIYILIERSVYAEFGTFQKNKDRDDIEYFHVDSESVFHMIEEILNLPHNNPVLQFDRFQEIESWLREQWAGLFQKSLRQIVKQKELESLSTQVSRLSDISGTLKTYLEAVMQKVPSDKSQEIIDQESKRLEDARIDRELRDNEFVQFTADYGIPFERIKAILSEAESIEYILNSIDREIESPFAKRILQQIRSKRKDYAKKAIKSARDSLRLPELEWTT